MNKPFDAQQKTASFEAALGAELDPETCIKPSTSFSGSTPHLSYHLFAIAILVVLVLIPPAYVLGSHTIVPISQIVSPLSEASVLPTPTPAPPIATKVYAPSDYVSVSQRYFTDAQTLSQKRQQTDEDKKEILGKLQQAIDTISEGINIYPNKSELWVHRASIYTAIRTFMPQATQAAVHDLEQAQRLSQHSSHPPNLPREPNGLELVKDQQALRSSGQSSRDVLVAAPGEALAPYQDTKESSAFSGVATMPAGQTEIVIQNASVTDAAPIYVVPKTQTNGTLSVTSKQPGKSFTVTLDNAQNTDVPFQYWVTK